MKTFLFSLCLCGIIHCQQSVLILVPINFSDGEREIVLNAGIDPFATDSLDDTLGEQELPPLPPSGIFDVRFNFSKLGNGSLNDFRYGNLPISAAIEYPLYVQREADKKIIIKWNLPSGTTGKLTDFFDGLLINVDMIDSGYYLLTNYVINRFRIIIKYNLLSSKRDNEGSNNYFDLKQNYPNPFNPSTVIQYNLPVESKVQVTVYNSLGELVSELINDCQSAGYYQREFDAGNLPSGIYFYSLSVQSTDGNKNFHSVKKMLLIK